MGEKMDRGTDAFKSHISSISKMEVRQTRRGFCQEILGCEARTEFKYFIEGTQVAHSIEDSDCCCRFWISPNHPFTMEVKELNTDAEMITIDRPCRCSIGCCKCCCYQEISVNSGGQVLGTLKEDFWLCVPAFTSRDEAGSPIYKIHQPTCCCGMCVDCFTEDECCGCCKVSLRVYPATQSYTGGGAPYVGKILRGNGDLEVMFPDGSTVAQKGVLLGSSLLLNGIIFHDIKLLCLLEIFKKSIGL